MTNDQKHIRGSVALVTGASSGIGRATAIALKAKGFFVFATAPDPTGIEDLGDELCRVVELDVTDQQSAANAVAKAESIKGRLDLLVNNAGYGQYGPIEEISLNAIKDQFEVNLFGLIRMCQLVLPAMREAKAGRIINISSVAGEINQPGAGIYHATKHAIEAVDGALRVEVEPFGIKVIGILPGPVDTNFAEVAVATIPDTGADRPYYIFKQNLEKVTREMLDPEKSSGVLMPDDVAAKVVEAATADSPSARYHVGAMSKVLATASGLLPDPIWDAALKHQIPADRLK